jgi:hypothetical protein
MMSASLSEAVMRRIFLDINSPYAQSGFSASLHSDVTQEDGTTEIAAPTYARAVIGHGEGYWSIGARTVQNRLEIVFPASGLTDLWPPARSIGLWSLDTSTFLWSVPFDIGEYTVSTGDRLVIPSGGLVVGIG